MKTSQKGIDLIKRFEGCRLKAYKCPAGRPTIGFGHTMDVTMDTVITMDKAIELLRTDLVEREDTVNRLRLKINQNQFDALVSFVYNCGSGTFLKSQLYVLIQKNPNDPEIRRAFKRHIYAVYKDGIDNNGNGLIDEKGEKAPLTGLIKRRNAEADLYFTPTL